jgi:hypothetical protein
MAESALIEITDVQTYRRVDPKFDTTRFDAFEQETRRKNLRGLLGDALYYAFMNDARTDGVYADLLNGKSYTYQNQTIQYYGLKPYLCYLWLAIGCREGDLFMSNYGAIEFVNNPQQNFESSKAKERIATNYIQTAQDYANDIIKFLNENKSDYPIWEGDSETKPTIFLTFKI